MEIITQSAQETQKLGQKIGADLRKGVFRPRVFALYGELGSGKTTFLQGLADGLGISQRILSPTFVFIREYPLTTNRFSVFYHVDLYRLETAKEAKGLGLKEFLSDPGAVVAIEWAEKMKALLPKKRVDIFFELLSQNKRKIEIIKD